MSRGSEDREAALSSAASRLAHAMRDSYGPVDRMAAALECMMRALASHGRALERLRAGTGDTVGCPDGASPAPLRELENCREVLEREIAICIESLQFHDSLMQQLTQVRLGLASVGGMQHPQGEMRLTESGAGSVELF